MGTSRVRFGGIFQGSIVARLRTGMYRIYHTKRSGDKVSLFSHLKVERRRLQDMAFVAQAWLYTAIKCFACQRVKKGFDIDILCTWQRDTPGSLHTLTRPDRLVSSPKIPICRFDRIKPKFIGLWAFGILSWDRGPDRPGPFGGLNCTYFHGKFVIMMIKGEDFLHLRSPNEPQQKVWGHHFGNIKMQWENYSRLLPEPMKRHFRSIVTLSHSQFYVHSLVQLNRGRPSSSFMHATLPRDLPRKVYTGWQLLCFHVLNKTAVDISGARLQRPASQNEETQWDIRHLESSFVHAKRALQRLAAT